MKHENQPSKGDELSKGAAALNDFMKSIGIKDPQLAAQLYERENQQHSMQCYPGELCVPKSWFCQIQECEICGKLS